MAPDNSYRYFSFNGNHKEIAIFDAGKRNYRKISVTGGPGVGRSQVYHPRWSNHTRFLTVTGPAGGNNQEVLLGRFNVEFTKVEAWVQVSQNSKPDFYGDAWLESGWRPADNPIQQQPHLANHSNPTPPANTTVLDDRSKDMSAYKVWPGDQKDLQFSVGE